MAEEQALAAETSPVPSDLKRKFQDLEEPEQPIDQQHPESNANSNSDGEKADAAVSDEGEKKRPRVDEELDGLGTFVLDSICSSHSLHMGASYKRTFFF